MVEEVVADFPDYEEEEGEELVPDYPEYGEEPIEQDDEIAITEISPVTPSDTEYIKNQRARESYEGSSEHAQDVVNELNDDSKVPLQQEEEQKIMNGDSSWVDIASQEAKRNVGGRLSTHSITDPFMKRSAELVAHSGYGFKNMLRSVVGKVSDEGKNFISKPPDPETTLQTIYQGFTRYGSLFFPVNAGAQAWAQTISFGPKFAKLLQKSPKLLKLIDRRWVAFTASGGVAEGLAFEHTDPNMMNFFMSLTGISEHSTVGAFLNEWIATNPSDSKLWGTSKNFFAGIWSAALLDSVFRMAGFGYMTTAKQIKKIKEATKEKTLTETTEILTKEVKIAKERFETEHGVTVEETQEAVEELVEDGIDILEEALLKANPQEKIKLQQGLPGSVKEGLEGDIRHSMDDAVAPISETLDNPNPKLVDLLHKIANKEDIGHHDLTFVNKHGKTVPLIESFNLNKIKTRPEMLNILQAIGKVLDLKKLKRPSHQDGVADVANLLGKSQDEIFEFLKKNTANIQEAEKFVPAYKIMVVTAIKQANLAMEKLGRAIPGSAEYKVLKKEAYAHAANVQEAMTLASDQSYATSRLMNAQKAAINEDTVEASLQSRLYGEVIDKTSTMVVHQAKQHTRLSQINNSKIREYKVSVRGQKFKVKADPKLTKSFKKTQKKIVTTEQRIARLEKRLQDAKDRKPSPKRTKVIREKTARELELEELIEAERAKTRLPKEQLDLRKRHLALSNKIKKLREEKKTASESSAQIKTTEIHELEAEVAKLTKRFTKTKTDPEKAAANVKSLQDELNKLILTKKGTPKPPKTSREYTELEKELTEEIKNQHKRLKWLKDKRVTTEDLREQLLQGAEKAQIEAIELADNTQLRNMLKATQMSVGAKTRDAFLEIYINGLLSSIKTLEVNAFGNTYAIGNNIFERFLAASRAPKIGMPGGGRIRPEDGGITYREVGQLMYHYISAIPDSLKAFRVAWKHGPADGAIKDDLVRRYRRSLNKELWGARGGFGKAIDYLGHLVNIPGKLVMSSDELFKVLTYRGELGALSYRKAVKQFGKRPRTAAELAEVDILQNKILSDLDLHEDILEQATKSAREATYTSKLADVEVMDALGNKSRVSGMTQLVKTMIERDPTGILRVFLPFFQTPANLLIHNFRRMPVLNRFSKVMKDELNSDDPAIRQLAEAKLAAGQYMWSGVFALAWNGQITDGPPANPHLRKRMEKALGGPHWYSINAGWGWIPYNRLDPIGFVLSSAATVTQLGKSYMHLNDEYRKDNHAEERKWKATKELMTTGIVNMSRLITDRYYFQGLSDMMDFFTGDPHEKRNSLKRLMMAGDPSLSFYSSLRRNVTRGMQGVIPEKGLPPLPEGETQFEKITSVIVGEMTRAHDQARNSLNGWQVGVPEGGAVQNLMGEYTFAPGTHFEDINNIRPFEVITNLSQSLTNPIPSRKQSDSFLIHKLAELNSKVQGPSDITSIPLGSFNQTSLGVLHLTDEEKEAIKQEWIALNKKTPLEKLAKSKEFNKPKNMSWDDFTENHDGLLPDGQLQILEGIIRENKTAAISLVMFNEKKYGNKFIAFRNRFIKAQSNARISMFEPEGRPTLGIMKQFQLDTPKGLSSPQQQ